MNVAEPSESNTPWQLKWKRPKLLESLHDAQLDRMIPIESKSARLTTTEACSIIEYVRNSSNNIDALEGEGSKDCHIDTNQDKMKWEDLESSSDEDEDGTFNQNRSQEQYVLNVTILASEASVRLLTILQENNLLMAGSAKELLAADSMYLEVVKDSITIVDQNSGGLADLTKNDEKVTVITSKLLHWPSSTYIDTETLSTPNSLPEGFFNAIHKAMNRVKSQTESVEEANYHLHRKLQQKAKLLRQRIGVTSLALCRRTTTDHYDEKLDFDDLCEILDRIAFGTLSKSEYLAPHKGFHDPNESQALEQGENELRNELLLSCVTNNGHVYLFSALDILIRPDTNVENKASNQPLNFLKEHNSDEILTNEFEALLFGRELQNKVKEKILPLSEPKACIALSVVTGINSDEEINEERTPVENEENSNTNQFRKETVPLKNDFLDFSFLDSNIEARTAHYRTIRNIPTTCVAAYEHVVIGGKGVRQIHRKTKSSTDTSGDTIIEEPYHQGGFISFISMKRLNEDRTLFLPWPPKAISPVRLNSMELVIVTGRGGECLAIRTDSSSIIPFHSKLDGNQDNTSRFNYDLLVEKFSLLDISFSPNEYCDDGSEEVAIPISVTPMTTNPPSIVCYYFDGSNIFLTLQQMAGFELKQNQDSRLMFQTQTNSTRNESQHLSSKEILCTHEDRHSVQIPLHFLSNQQKHSSHLMDKLWCTCGNGWSILGLEYEGILEVYFVLWEGAKDAAFYRNVLSDSSNNYSISNILPVSLLDAQKAIIHKNTVISPSLRSYSSDSILSSKSDEIHPDSIISSVIEEIRSSPPPPSIMSDLLLSKCTSWTQLHEMSINTDEQIAVATITYSGKNYFLTLRGHVANSPATPFQEIISWLCQRKDYYTAASVALHLLDDIETIQDLTGYGSIYSKDILDGIAPVKFAYNEFTKEETVNEFTSNHTRLNKRIISSFTSLADLAVVCLVKGHAIKALDGFLHRNKHYDASRACLILGASTALAVSQISQLNAVENLAPFSFNPLMSETHALWPIQCLLGVAMTRKRMQNVLLLLNATIPHEMRHISSDGQTCSIALCKSIISMILASSSDSAGILLNLVHQGTNTFWNSISTSTRFELSLLQIQGKFPFFLEIEVRQWALVLLQKATGLLRNSTPELDLPITWLQKLCLACLCNSECDFTTLGLDISIEGKNSKSMFSQLETEEVVTRKILASGQYDIDFDLLIPSLILLEKRNVDWNNDIMISTKSLLNMSCYLAGRPTSDETGFTFDSASVMKQCALMGNIGAAAYLIGGNDGIILKCANIITYGDASRIQEAEEYLVGRRDDVYFTKKIVNRKSSADDFLLTEGHCEILRYLDKCVFNARKYGEFLSVSTRGNIDPAFASRVCLRAWLSLCRSEKAPHSASGQWLENWLEENMQKDGKVLARAALTHCLLWTEIRNINNEKTVLAESLGLSSRFLVMIAKKASHGLLSVV